MTAAQLDRACGVLLGTAAGDTLGAPFEFGPPLGADVKVDIDDDVSSRSMWETGEWTDDTSMAIATAEVVASWADLRDETAQDAIMLRWHQWAHEPDAKKRRRRMRHSIWPGFAASRVSLASSPSYDTVSASSARSTGSLIPQIPSCINGPGRPHPGRPRTDFRSAVPRSRTAHRRGMAEPSELTYRAVDSPLGIPARGPNPLASVVEERSKRRLGLNQSVGVDLVTQSRVMGGSLATRTTSKAPLPFASVARVVIASSFRSTVTIFGWPEQLSVAIAKQIFGGQLIFGLLLGQEGLSTNASKILEPSNF